MEDIEQRFAGTPPPPYCAVIFTNLRARGHDADYEKTAARMRELAVGQEGFLGLESVRDAGGFGVTVSYWRDAECARRWKQNAEHLQAQKMGREKFYRLWRLRVCTVEREYGNNDPAPAGD